MAGHGFYVLLWTQALSEIWPDYLDDLKNEIQRQGNTISHPDLVHTSPVRVVSVMVQIGTK